MLEENVPTEPGGSNVVKFWLCADGGKATASAAANVISATRTNVLDCMSLSL
jgi:hypothetical protein